MRRYLLAGLLVLAACSRGPATDAALPDPALPNPSLTPGRTTAATREEICQPGYTRKVRSVSEGTKRRVYSAYHRSRQPGVCCEVDHLIPLELGGANSPENLWPQLWEGTWGARAKDQLENRLHRLVCSGRLDLSTAQQVIAKDWVAAWHTYVNQ